MKQTILSIAFGVFLTLGVIGIYTAGAKSACLDTFSSDYTCSWKMVGETQEITKRKRK